MRTEFRRQERRRTLGLVGGLVALIGVVGLAGFWAARVTAANFFDFGENGDFSRSAAGVDPRTHSPLAPIPVEQTACPYLAPVHDTALELRALWSANLASPMPTLREQLDPKLATFVLQLRNAEAHVPAPVAERLRTVIWHVEVGRGEMQTATSPIEFALAADSPLALGLGALLDASDLVGDACGERLYQTL